MSIRFATVADIPALVEGGQRMHALTRFRHQPYIADKVARTFEALIAQERQRYVFLVAEGASQRVVGGLIGVLEQQIFSDAWTASVMHFDVLPEARMGGHAVRLLKAFERWARNRQVIEICLGVNSGEDLPRLSRFAHRMGYATVGENHVKTLIR